MSPTERRRPITRRKRIAHLGIGGVLAAAAGAQTGAVLASPAHEAKAADPPSVATIAAPSEPVALTEPAHRHHRPPTRDHLRRGRAVAPTDIGPVWTALAACESSGHWNDTAGEFEGGVQFLNSTWLEYGGGRYAQHAYDATEAEQIDIARKLLDADGPHPWPVCGPKVGLAKGD